MPRSDILSVISARCGVTVESLLGPSRSAPPPNVPDVGTPRGGSVQALETRGPHIPAVGVRESGGDYGAKRCGAKRWPGLSPERKAGMLRLVDNLERTVTELRKEIEEAGS